MVLENLLQERLCKPMQGVPCPRTPEELLRGTNKVEEGGDRQQLESE